MSGGAGPSKKPKTSHFHREWESFFFTVIFEVRLPHLPVYHRNTEEGKCGAAFSNYDTNFPPKSELRKKMVKEFKCHLSGQQSLFSQLTSKVKAATEASFRVSHLIEKNKKSFQDGEMVKEAFVEAADSLFRDLKTRQKYYLPSKLSSCQEAQLRGAVRPWPRI